ncbi:MAG: NfeD family protein [Synechococcaceae cyanobacterium]
MTPLLWLALAGLLLLIELIVPGFGGFLIGAIAAMVVSALAAPLALSPGLQWALFVALTAAGTAALWQWSRRQRPRELPPSGQAELAEVIEGFEGTRDQGRVRWQGQSWAAVCLNGPAALPPGSWVQVLGREGTRLQVLAPDPEA